MGTNGTVSEVGDVSGLDELNELDVSKLFFPLSADLGGCVPARKEAGGGNEVSDTGDGFKGY